ncbi:hypothetical protein ACFSYD_17760 [Paracoccus aerius]
MSPPLLMNTDARRLFLDRHLLLRQGSGPGTGADLGDVLGAWDLSRWTASTRWRGRMT